jgi:hypothetical protein
MITDHGLPSVLAEGAALPSLHLLDASGKHVVIAYDSAGKPTLFYIFSPSCGWCRRNAPEFRLLERQIGGEVRIIRLALSPEGLDSFARETGMDIEVYIPLPSTVRSYGLGETPTTILVSGSGKVLKMWRGAYTGDTRASIEGFFKFKLCPS